MRFVIVTGMSGAGKSTAMKMMEDMGFFCIDNLPIPLLDKLVDFATAATIIPVIIRLFPPKSFLRIP